MGFFLLPKGSKVDLIVQTGIFAIDWVDFYIFVVAMGFPLALFIYGITFKIRPSTSRKQMVSILDGKRIFSIHA